MLRAILTCLLFILPNSILAQADYNPVEMDLSSQVLEADGWNAVYEGTAYVDGERMHVVMEKTEALSEAPSSMANSMQTLLSLQPRKVERLRLTLSLDKNPAFGARYALVGREKLRSAPKADSEFAFVIENTTGPSLHAAFTRHSAPDSVGHVFLLPVSPAKE